MSNKRINSLRAAVYARYSSDGQREESIDAQVRAIREYANRNGFVIVGQYIDRARSATTDNRPDFQRMIQDSTLFKFDIVIVHKLDRFSRDRYDSAHYKHILRRNGVRLCSVIENLDGSPESIIMESVLEGMAEYYSKNLARETMKGMRENALKGRHTGGKPPLGYDVDPESRMLVINEGEAKIVRLIFKMALEGGSYGDIMNEIHRRGYKTKRGGDFGKNALHSILANDKYTGVYTFSKRAGKDVDGKYNPNKFKDESEIIRIDGAVPALVSKKDFEKVRELLL